MALAGKSGKLMVGTNNVTEIKNWSLNLGLDTLDDIVNETIEF